MLEMLRYLDRSKKEGLEKKPTVAMPARKTSWREGERPVPWHSGIDPNEIIADYEKLKSAKKTGALYGVSEGAIQAFLRDNFKDRYQAVANRLEWRGGTDPAWHSSIDPNEVIATYERLMSARKAADFYNVRLDTMQRFLERNFIERYHAIAGRQIAKIDRPRKSK